MSQHSARIRAFETAVPAGWTPDAGDEVYLPPRTPFKLSIRARVAAVVPGAVKVRYRVYRKEVEYVLALADVRPIDPPRPRRVRQPR